MAKEGPKRYRNPVSPTPAQVGELRKGVRRPPQPTDVDTQWISPMLTPEGVNLAWRLAVLNRHNDAEAEVWDSFQAEVSEADFEWRQRATLKEVAALEHTVKRLGQADLLGRIDELLGSTGLAESFGSEDRNVVYAFEAYLHRTTRALVAADLASACQWVDKAQSRIQLLLASKRRGSQGSMMTTRHLLEHHRTELTKMLSSVSELRLRIEALRIGLEP